MAAALPMMVWFEGAAFVRSELLLEACLRLFGPAQG